MTTPSPSLQPGAPGPSKAAPPPALPPALPSASPSTTTPLRIGILLFPAFQSLDLFGPHDVFQMFGLHHPVPLHLSVLSTSLDPVSTLSAEMAAKSPTFFQTILPTCTLSDAPPLDILIVPGGKGTRDKVAMEPYVDFIRRRWDDPNLKYVLSICTGAALVAQSGLVDGFQATTNKAAFSWVESQGPGVAWVKRARWVDGGKWWSSSGVSAGTDMALGWIEKFYGEGAARRTAVALEWVRTEAEEDEFAEVNGLV